MHSRSIIEKIWDYHVIESEPNCPDIFAIDFMLMHEVTSSQAFDVLRSRGLPVFDTTRVLATPDHSIPTREDRFVIYDEDARIQVQKLRENCQEFGVPFYDMESGYQGIVHVIGPELGVTQPGMTIVCGDSHTSTHGAFGAIAFGIGTTEVGHVLATGALLQKRPKTMKIELNGSLRPGVYSKDVILAVIAAIGTNGGAGHIIEFTGSLIPSLSMEERMTICNMSIECGARAGVIAPDEVTFAYLKGRPRSPKDWERAVKYWSSLVSDPDATYDRSFTLDVSTLEPMVTWGTTPEEGVSIYGNVPRLSSLSARGRQLAERSLSYMDIKEGDKIHGLPIDWAFIGACTNGRIEDLRIAAEVLKGRRVAPHVTFYIVPGSEQVREQAKREGLVEIFTEAGASFRNPGCSMCVGMNDDRVPAGQRCISATNRNFIGRQGTGSRTHLASPATVAASAIAGCISSVGELV